MFLLDTNVVSELRKVRSGRAKPGVAQWAADAPSGQLFTSAIAIEELEHGELLAERSDPAQGAVLRRWLDGSVTVASSERILPVDEQGGDKQLRPKTIERPPTRMSIGEGS